MDMVRYKARDGLEIPAYLTLPASAGDLKKNLPLYVHGGPWARGATGNGRPTCSSWPRVGMP
jgi:dipeptidyl aminopeptidase/acylaminoacyl peptidase